jgi:hypothetical protein
MNQTSTSVTSAAPTCNRADGLELVLRGHGMLGAAHIGVLKAFAENGKRVDTITGMSLGAVVATLYANGADSSEITKLFLNRKARRFMRDVWLGQGQCDVTAEPLQQLLPAAKLFVARKRLKPRDNLRLICYDVTTRRSVVFEGTDYDLATALAASCSVAGVMRPVRRGKSLLVDCSLYGCKVEKPDCGHTAVSDAFVEGEVPQDKLSTVDGWLHRRGRLIAPESDCSTVAGDGCLTIRTVIPSELINQCGCSEKRIKRIIAAGYEAAKAALSKTA